MPAYINTVGTPLEGKVSEFISAHYFYARGKTHTLHDIEVSTTDRNNYDITVMDSLYALPSQEEATAYVQAPGYNAKRKFIIRKNDNDKTPEQLRNIIYVLIKKIDPSVITYQDGLAWIQNELDALNL